MIFETNKKRMKCLLLLQTFSILKFSYTFKMSMPTVQSVNYETKMSDMQEMYLDVKNMTEETYDENTVINSMRIISVLGEFPNEYKKTFAAMLFKILTTVAGRIFLKKYKKFTISVAYKAEEFMRVLDDSYKTDEKSAELAKAISEFSIYNEQAFIEHGISYTTYHGYDDEYKAQEHYPEEEDDYSNDEEYNEDDEEYNEDDEEYNEDDEVYHEDDIEEYEEYVHGYEDDDDEDDDDYEQAEELRKQRMIQSQKDKMKIVLDQLKRRDDPFYQAALACVKTKQKEWEDGWREEANRHGRVLRNILRRELETGNEIENGKYFKCDYELVEQFTECKVENKINKKFGCDVCIKYDDYLFNVTVIIFDGTFIHEFVVLSNLPKVMQNLKAEIRKDTAQCLYDTKLVCRDVAGLISAFVC